MSTSERAIDLNNSHKNSGKDSAADVLLDQVQKIRELADSRGPRSTQTRKSQNDSSDVSSSTTSNPGSAKPDQSGDKAKAAGRTDTTARSAADQAEHPTARTEAPADNSKGRAVPIAISEAAQKHGVDKAVRLMFPGKEPAVDIGYKNGQVVWMDNGKDAWAKKDGKDSKPAGWYSAHSNSEATNKGEVIQLMPLQNHGYDEKNGLLFAQREVNVMRVTKLSDGTQSDLTLKPLMGAKVRTGVQDGLVERTERSRDLAAIEVVYRRDAAGKEIYQDGHRIMDGFKNQRYARVNGAIALTGESFYKREGNSDRYVPHDKNGHPQTGPGYVALIDPKFEANGNFSFQREDKPGVRTIIRGNGVMLETGAGKPEFGFNSEGLYSMVKPPDAALAKGAPIIRVPQYIAGTDKPAIITEQKTTGPLQNLVTTSTRRGNSNTWDVQAPYLGNDRQVHYAHNEYTGPYGFTDTGTNYYNKPIAKEGAKKGEKTVTMVGELLHPDGRKENTARIDDSGHIPGRPAARGGQPATRSEVHTENGITRFTDAQGAHHTKTERGEQIIFADDTYVLKDSSGNIVKAGTHDRKDGIHDNWEFVHQQNSAKPGDSRVAAIYPIVNGKRGETPIWQEGQGVDALVRRNGEFNLSPDKNTVLVYRPDGNNLVFKTNDDGSKPQLMYVGTRSGAKREITPTNDPTQPHEIKDTFTSIDLQHRGQQVTWERKLTAVPPDATKPAGNPNVPVVRLYEMTVTRTHTGDDGKPVTETIVPPTLPDKQKAPPVLLYGVQLTGNGQIEGSLPGPQGPASTLRMVFDVPEIPTGITGNRIPETVRFARNNQKLNAMFEPIRQQLIAQYKDGVLPGTEINIKTDSPAKIMSAIDPEIRLAVPTTINGLNEQQIRAINSQMEYGIARMTPQPGGPIVIPGWPLKPRDPADEPVRRQPKARPARGSTTRMM